MLASVLISRLAFRCKEQFSLARKTRENNAQVKHEIVSFPGGGENDTTMKANVIISRGKTSELRSGVWYP